MNYDDSNIFAKIIRKEIPCEKVYEDEDILCFKDINPSAQTHVLIIPKDNYLSFGDFVSKASSDKISNYFKKIKLIAEKLELNKSGYRLITNCGKNANQEVLHFHMHMLGGENLGPLLSKKK